MSISSEQLDAFHRFASEQIAAGVSNHSMVELAAIWEAEIASASEEIRSGYENLKNNRGVPVEDAVQKLREKHNIPENP